jgi:hypothetical protein
MLDFLALPVILLAYFGFAGGWGWLYRSAMDQHHWLAGTYGLLVMLPASAALPMHIPWLVFAIVAAGSIAMLVAWQPARLPVWIFSRRVMYVYLLAELGLIFLWGMACAQVGIAAAAGITLVVVGGRLAPGGDLISGRPTARSGRESKRR